MACEEEHDDGVRAGALHHVVERGEDGVPRGLLPGSITTVAFVFF
jgi:hypothetical protein